jgi:hypothetical protein
MPKEKKLDAPKMPEFSPTRGGFEIGPTEPTPKAKGENGERADPHRSDLVVDIYAPKEKDAKH